MTDIIVNLADESITDLDNAVVVMDWDQGDLSNEDTVLYAEAHGKRLAALVEFARKVAAYRTMDEIKAETADKDYEEIADDLDDARDTAVDDLDGLIAVARGLV